MSLDHPSLDAENYYRATATSPDTGLGLDGDEVCDVCIIGAGFTGLSAALELAQAGRSVIVLDRGAIGQGASGRNGGQLCTGFSPGMAGFEKQLGRDKAQACFDMSREALSLITHRIKEHDINCDLKWGYLNVAAKASHMADLEDYRNELQSYGYGETELIDKKALGEKLASPAYYGALLDRKAGHFHPLAYCFGVARAAMVAGARICENTPALSVSDGAPATVRTGKGTISASQVIVACNGYIDGLISALETRVMPVASYVIATEPLGEERARALIRNDEAVGDSNFVVDYFRLTADHRMLFGGRCSYSGVHPRDLAGNMRPRLARVFPDLADSRIDYAWGGHIGITYNRLPDAGRHGRAVYYAQGYCGQGAVLAGFFGKLMADAIRGDSDKFDVFTQLRHLPFPGGILRRPALTLGMLYYRLRDLLA